MTYIENIFLCLALPLILSLFFMKGRGSALCAVFRPEQSAEARPGPLFPGRQLLGGLLMRSVRYGLVLFVLIAIYPYAFRLKKKLFRK